MDYALEDLEGEPPEVQHEVLNQIEAEIESEETSNAEIAEFLLTTHQSQLFTVQASSRVPKLLRKIGNSGGGDHLIELVVNDQYDQSLILESLCQSDYSQSGTVAALVHEYIEEDHFNIELLRPILSRINGDDIELPLDPYHDDEHTLGRALEIIDALDTADYEDNIIEVYRRILYGQLGGRVEGQILEHFTQHSTKDIIPLLEERIRKSIEENDHHRRNIPGNAVNALAEQGDEGINVLLSFLEELDHRDNQKRILNAISQSEAQLTEEHINVLISLSEQDLGRDHNQALAKAVIANGELNDMLRLANKNSLSEPHQFSDQLFKTLEDHDDVNGIIRFLEAVDNPDIFRRNAEEFIQIVSSHGADALINLIEADVRHISLNDGQQLIVKALLNKTELDLEPLIDLLQIGTNEELVVNVLHSCWDDAMPILLNELSSTEHDSEIENLQTAFEGLSEAEVDSVLNEILSPVDRSGVELEALRIGVTSVKSGARSYAQDRLIEAVDKNIGHPSLSELCKCIDNFRFSDPRSRSFTGDQRAVPDRKSMPKPLPGLRDLVVSRHNENRIRSILDLLETLDSLGSNVYDELMSVLPDNVRQDIMEYRNSTTNLDTLRKEGVEDLVKEGEGLLIEFKHPAASDEKILREVESMLNTQGGTVLVGVDDSGTITGLDDSRWDCREEAETRFQSLVGSYIRPEPVVDSYSVHVSGMTVLRIDIPSGDMKPYFHRDEEIANEVRIRMGSKKVLASRRHIINLIRHGSWHKTG